MIILRKTSKESERVLLQKFLKFIVIVDRLKSGKLNGSHY
jgi:hypothetical protein